MASWGEVAKADCELVEFGRELFEQFGIAFLGTVRKDGGPRIHPVCPMIVQGHLIVGIAITSPKRFDLCNNGRYVLHALPGPNDAEFFVRGHAVQVNNPDIQAIVAAVVANAGVAIREDTLFELDIELAHLVVYELCENPGQAGLVPRRRQWKSFSPCPHSPSTQ
ncbi:MAG TPA: hypothetical protein VJ761_18235 [Ktedonobacteraceae bacterium]|nr:hypothetical protein [Ktedonobacteraceae bacterium]